MTDGNGATEVTPEAILQLGLGFWGSKTLLSAVELGAVHRARPRRAARRRGAARRLGLHPRSARDFLDALVALGMLEREDGTLRQHAGDRAVPRPGQAVYIGGMLEMANARLYPFWGSLTEALRTGEPQNEAKSGGDFFDDALRRPARLGSSPRP